MRRKEWWMLLLGPGLSKKRSAEELVLPAGQYHYMLPLVTGRANRRPISSDLRLDSASFPLQHDVRVQLELSYQYGVENGYELKVIPVEPETAPFSELKGKWVRSDRTKKRPTTNPVPPFPDLRDVDLHISTTAIADIRREAERLLSGRASNPQGTVEWLTRQLRKQREELEQAAFRAFENSDVVEVLRKIIDNYRGLGVPQDKGKKLKIEAFLFLYAFGEQVPETIAMSIRTKLDSDELDSVPEYYANATGILHRIEPNKHWLDLLWKNVILRIEPYENPQLYGGSIYEIARTAWILPDFLEDFASRNPDFVQKSLHVIERGIRNVVSKAAQAIDPDSETEIYGGHVRGFQSCCELVLALLRLRDTQLGVPLAAGSPRMSRLAKSIRRADCLLTRADKKVRPSLDFGLAKPESLARVSDLAYAANYYLLGDVTMNLARIDSVADDE